MAKLKSLFGKKFNEETDGQEEFFKEDFAPVVKVPSKKVETKAAPSKAGSDQTASKTTKTSQKAQGSTTQKKTTATVRPTESKRVMPQPVERIINPDAAKRKEAERAKAAAKKTPSKKSASAKKTTTKKAETAKSTTAKKAATTKAASTTKKAATKAAAPAKKTAVKSAAPAKNVSTKPIKLRQEIDDSSFVKGAVPIKESNGKWDIQRAKDGRFFFTLYASNHTAIAYSQIYSSTSAVTTGINSVITNAAKAETEDTTLKKIISVPCPKWEIYIDKAEQYRFRLYAPNGLIVCHSAHGYATKGGCKGGIESIKRFASEEAIVDKSYLK